MVSKRTNLNRNVASQARMMPLIKCCAASSGGLTAKTASVAKGIRQTASQRMISGLDMVCDGQNKDNGKRASRQFNRDEGGFQTDGDVV